MKRQKAERKEGKQEKEKRERQRWGKKRDFGGLKYSSADSLKVCDLNIHQNFLCANIVVIDDQALYLTFSFIARDDKMSSAQANFHSSPAYKNQQAAAICLQSSTQIVHQLQYTSYWNFYYASYPHTFSLSSRSKAPQLLLKDFINRLRLLL